MNLNHLLVSHTFTATFGPMKFWNGVALLFKEIRPRTYLEYPEWDVFFTLAYDCGMGEFFEDRWGKRTFRYGSIGLALLEQFRRVKVAKAKGQSAHDFHLSEQIDLRNIEDRRIDSSKPQSQVRAAYRSTTPVDV